MVQLSVAVLRLHLVDLRCIVYVVTEEIDGLTSGVDLCLIDVLALAQHTGCIHNGAIFRGEQLGHLHHDSGTGGPGCTAPFLPGFHSCLNSHLNLFLANFVIGGQHMLVVVGTGYLTSIASTDFLAANDDGNVDHQIALTLQFFLKCNTLWRTCQISFYRLVGRCGE